MSLHINSSMIICVSCAWTHPGKCTALHDQGHFRGDGVNQNLCSILSVGHNLGTVYLQPFQCRLRKAGDTQGTCVVHPKPVHRVKGAPLSGTAWDKWHESQLLTVKRGSCVCHNYHYYGLLQLITHTHTYTPHSKVRPPFGITWLNCRRQDAPKSCPKVTFTLPPQPQPHPLPLPPSNPHLSLF